MTDQESLAGVYQISNLETGEYYIGATTNLVKRKGEHFGDLEKGKHRNPLLQKSFDSTKKEMEFAAFPVGNGPMSFKIEKELIKQNKDDPKCLNLRGGKEFSGKRRVVSEEGRRKLSEARKRLYESGFVSPMKGKKMSDEARKKMSESRKRLYASGYVTPFTGADLSPEARKLRSEKTKQQWSDPEYQKLMKEKAAARTADPDFIERHRNATIEGLRKKGLTRK